MTNTDRAVAYLEAAYGCPIVVDPHLFEPGFYKLSKYSRGSTYFSKVAYIGEDYLGKAVLVDVTGDRDEILFRF